MYTEYERTQFRIEHIWGDITGPHPSPPNIFDRSHKPSIMPSKLVCVETWEVVNGEDVNEGYCALSYSWSWSGDMVSDNNKNLHKITTYYQKDGWILKDTKEHSFEEVIQQVCIDFNIRYIWFDKLCINQSDTKQKQAEIKQMHSIYNLAHYTIVLIPELCAFRDQSQKIPKVTSNILDMSKISEWCRRSWTLEEAYMSRKLLFIGRNVHMWSNAAEEVRTGLGYDDHFFFNVCTKPEKRNASTALWNASTVLWHARNRTSSKEHDRVFALANMLPKIRNRINFDYEQRILNLMRDFYSLVAETDLSILCFGAPLDAEVTRLKKEAFNNPPDSDSLPSWSGINGLHLPQLDPEDLHLQAAANVEYNLQNGLFLNLKCSCATIFLKSADDPHIPQSNRNTGYKSVEERFQNIPVLEEPDNSQAAYGFFPEASTRMALFSTTINSHYTSNVTLSTPDFSDQPPSTLLQFQSTRLSSPNAPIQNRSNPYQNSQGLTHGYPMFPSEPMSDSSKVLDTISEHRAMNTALNLYPKSHPNSDCSRFQVPKPMPVPIPGPPCIRMPEPVISPTVYSSLSFVPADGPAVHYETFMRTYGLKVTHWLPIKKIGDAWTLTKTSEAQHSGGYLSLIDDDCIQCHILSGVSFRISSKQVTAFPVVKFNGFYYRSIGLCFLTDSIKLDYGVNTVKKIIIN